MGNEREHLERRLAAVSQIARVMSASLGLDELMQVVYDAIAPFFQHEAYMVTRYFRSRNALKPIFVIEDGERMKGEEFLLGGFSGVVVQDEKPLYIPDLTARKPSLPEPITRGQAAPYGSWLGVPLRVRDRTIGVLGIATKSPNAYGPEDQQLLTTIADQLAVAIDNARLFDETRGQAERLALLNRVGKAVSTTLDLNELFDAVYREIAAAFEHDEFLVVLHEKPTNELHVLFGMMNGVRLGRERAPLGGLSGEVVKTGRTLHIRQYTAEKEHLPRPRLLQEETGMPESWLGVPLVTGDQVLGALCIMIDRPYAYSDAKVRLFETVADQLAVAIANAELFRSVRDAAEQLGVVNRIGRAIGHEDDLERLAETVYREIAPVFEADTFFIALLNEEAGVLDIPFMVDEGQRVDVGSVPFGEGLSSTVIRTRKMLHVRSTDEYAQAAGNPSLHGTMKAPATWLGIPLFVEGRVIGVINVQSYQPNAYTDEKALLLTTIADQIAMSFERARLFQAVKKELAERVRAEELLAAERALLRTIINNIPDFIYAKDLDGRLVVANASLARLFGYEREDEILGKSIGDLLPQDEAEGHLEEERRILGSETAVINKEEHIVHRALNEIRWLLVTKLALKDAEGKVIGLVGIDRDITERKRAEEEVKRYLAEVEVANEEVKTFAYIVSHDLRAPLVNLKGFSSELRDSMGILSPHLQKVLAGMEDAGRKELARVLEEDIPEALGFIEASVSRMDGFIHAVLKLSRIGRRELAFQPVDVAEFVERSHSSLAHQMAERHVALTVGELPRVTADPTAMEQIVGNLLTNAVNYLDPQRPGRIEIGGERTALGTRFWIRDNGRGIAKEDEDKVFAPFRRAGKQDVAGEGMGLSYVRTMVRQHGGRIWFESEPDVGTTFYFTIADRGGGGRSGWET